MSLLDGVDWCLYAESFEKIENDVRLQFDARSELTAFFLSVS